MTLHIVSSSREAQESFGLTPLGRSIRRLRKPPKLSLTFSNNGELGLPDVYNAAIKAADDSDTLLFVHDDVVIGDLDVEETLDRALEQYDIVGVAGGVRRAAGQVTWFGLLGQIDKAVRAGRLSGAVGHVIEEKGEFSVYGPAPRGVMLLDGVFLAVNAKTLRATGARFDPQFRYHFYDLDFCRQAEVEGLRIGTWFIPIIHRCKPGGYESPEWAAARDLYWKKWED